LTRSEGCHVFRKSAGGKVDSEALSMTRKPNILKGLMIRLMSNIIYEFIRDNWESWLE
jgi:hypothetical protein